MLGAAMLGVGWPGCKNGWQEAARLTDPYFKRGFAHTSPRGAALGLSFIFFIFCKSKDLTFIFEW